MKSIKLQKALLAICLALATTLKISNEINALINPKVAIDSQIWQTPYNASKEPIDEDTYSYQHLKFINDNVGKAPITEEKYINFLQGYINNDTTKQLASLLQVSFNPITNYQNRNKQVLINAEKLHQELLTHKNTDDAQLKNIKTALQNINEKTELEQTTEEKILSKLFKHEPKTKRNYDLFIDDLDHLINIYENEKIIKVDVEKQTSTLINLLEPVVQQLFREDVIASTILWNSWADFFRLDTLAQLVSKFIEAYRTKRKQTENIFLYKIEEYISANNIKGPLKRRQHIAILQDYIRNDINKYLALMILAKHFPNNTQTTQQRGYFKFAAEIYNILIENPLTDSPEDQIINENDAKKQISEILTDLSNISSKAGAKTQEDEILSSIFIKPKHKLGPDTPPDQLRNIINAYEQDLNTPVDKKHSLLLSKLRPVAEQLNQEHLSLNEYTPNNLDTLALLVRDFGSAYHNKKTLQQYLKETEKQYLAAHGKKYLQENEKQYLAARLQPHCPDLPSTHTRALQIYVAAQQLHYLYEIDYQDFLYFYYIVHNPAKYLALLIQANYNLIQFPEYISRDTSVSSNGIKDMLFSNTFSRLTNTLVLGIAHGDLDERTKDITQYIEHIRQGTPEKLPVAEQIIKELFINTLASPGEDNKERITRMKYLINQYKDQGQEPAYYSYLTYGFLSLLRATAIQLKEEAKDLEDQKEQEQLNTIAQLVSEISNEYNKKRKPYLLNNLANISPHKQALKLYAQYEDINKFGEKEYQNFLKYYIGDNLGKYLALLLQAKYNLIQFPSTIDKDHSLPSNVIYEMLTDGIQKGQIPYILKDMKKITEAIRQIQVYLQQQGEEGQEGPGSLTAADQIIKEVFINTPVPPEQDNTDRKNKLTALIDQCIKQEHDPQNESDLTDGILRVLGPIATQLQTEADAFTRSKEKEQLQALAQQIHKTFRAYVDKQKMQKLKNLVIKENTPQQSLKKSLKKLQRNKNYSTFTRALDYVVSKNKTKDIPVELYQETAKDYIKDNPVKYLALRIQEKTALIQFPKGTQLYIKKYPFTTQTDIGAVFDNKPPKIYRINKLKKTTKENADILAALKTIQHAKPETLTVAQRILALLFKKQRLSPEEINEPQLDLLTELINNYEQQEQEHTKELYPYSHIINLLGDVAKQLEEEADDFEQSKEQDQLKLLAHQIRTFFNLYKDKQAANEQANAPQEAKTNPNLPENNDGQNEENTENNINNTKKAGDEPNKDEEEEEEENKRKKEEKDRLEKEQGSKLSTTQKIINNLSATNKMLQIIMQILY